MSNGKTSPSRAIMMYGLPVSWRRPHSYMTLGLCPVMSMTHTSQFCTNSTISVVMDDTEDSLSARMTSKLNFSSDGSMTRSKTSSACFLTSESLDPIGEITKHVLRSIR